MGYVFAKYWDSLKRGETSLEGESVSTKDVALFRWFVKRIKINVTGRITDKRFNNE